MNDEKREVINKYFKKQKVINILEIEFIKYLNTNLYIRLDYYKKDYIYRLTWINLDMCTENNLLNFLNVEIVPSEVCEYIIKLVQGKAFNSKKLPKKYDDDIVRIKINTKTLILGSNQLEFYRYLPIEYNFLVDVFAILSKNLPSKLDEFFIRTLAIISGQNDRYDYMSPIRFNIKKDDISKIIKPHIIERGKDYLNHIKFLEKIDNFYYAVIEGVNPYIVIIKEIEKNKVLLHCSCPCEFYCKHIYAALKAIQNGEEKKFYKVIYNNKDADLLDKLTNNDFILCVGAFEDRLRLINVHGEIGLLPILDDKGNCPWTILEDDEEKNLEKYIEEIIRKRDYE